MITPKESEEEEKIEELAKRDIKKAISEWERIAESYKAAAVNAPSQAAYFCEAARLFLKTSNALSNNASKRDKNSQTQKDEQKQADEYYIKSAIFFCKCGNRILESGYVDDALLALVNVDSCCIHIERLAKSGTEATNMPPLIEMQEKCRKVRGAIEVIRRQRKSSYDNQK